MADVGYGMWMLEVDNATGTNDSAPSNSTAPHDSCHDCVSATYLGIMGGALAGTIMMGILVFWLYRKRAHRKTREAGNINVAISRPNPK